MTAVAAVAFTVLLVALAIFQIALIAGVPWGRAAWGGADAVLPANKRIGSIVAVVLYVAFAIIALFRAGVVGDASEALGLVIAMWVVFGYLALGVVMNAISRSKLERFIMTPVALVLAILALVVALGR
ncbi:hypothetical protein [uncultured Schumannella sp.]|uniref:hypothetical protein n=1 Tax=uncultured Schumannella sp. TaxID=1195956 RepID=UPI0025F7EA5D|nr:hypothetical protein [uncultured Schumannella sp.]